MKKLCKNCSYWGRARVGACDAIQSSFQMAFPSFNNHYEKSFETYAKDGFAIYADADDDSGLQTELVTGPEFGCNKFYSK